jgi:hypothetical protein
MQLNPLVKFALKLGLASVGLGFAIIIAGGLPTSAEPVLQQVGSTKVRLLPPENFVPADRFSGFFQESSGASIMVVEMPAPFSELKAGFTNRDLMLQRGLTLLEQTPVSIQGRDAILLHVEQAAHGLEFRKWILALGNESETVLATATFPKEQAEKLSESVKQSLLTLQWDQNQDTRQPRSLVYGVQASGDLKLAGELDGSQFYAKNGSVPTQSKEDPFFVVAHSLSAQVILDPKAYTQARLLKTQDLEAIRILSTDDITIDGLSGYVITATAQEKGSKTPTTVYHVMLFEPDQNYFIMQGFVGTAIADQYLPVFKRMAQSFQRQTAAK